MKNLIYLTAIFWMIGCKPASNEAVPPDQIFQKAMENGQMANEGFRRCLSFVHAWLEHADPETGLIPRNLFDSRDIWNAKDAAADNYPFMVLTAAILDRDLYNGKMKDILEMEQKLTNRVDRLPDTYSFSKKDFETEAVQMEGIIFGASEYVKDGLLPLTEYIGQTAWSERMLEIIDDIFKHAAYETPFGKLPSLNVEVNGELLQALSRVYWMTGEKKYLDWALQLGDYYLLGDHHPTKNSPIIRLRDHGCEIVSGLCEIYLTVASALPDKKAVYEKPVYEMLDRILEVGRNGDGLFYNEVNPVSGEILDQNIADTYGYTFNAYYSVYLLDRHEPYRDAVLQALGNLDQYRNFDWERGSADGYADAIESALNLYNREPLDNVGDWVDSQTKIMWSMQDTAHRPGLEDFHGNGIIEGWHGDGNFARTTIMFCLWKTLGLTLSPWNKDLVFGAERDAGVVKLSLFSEVDWSGTLHFDTARHRNIFQLPMDYPRINQFPEWFCVEEEANYTITNPGSTISKAYSGQELARGFPLTIKKGEYMFMEIKESVKK